MEEINWRMRNNLKRLEELKKESLDSRDAVDYFKLCNELGEKPVVLDLYELGEAESNFGKLEKFIRTKRKRTIPDVTYKKFYEESRDFSFDIGSSTDEKRRLLIKYFPGRFGDEGRTPVCDIDYLRVGSLFNKMVNYSLKRINQ